MVSPSRDGTASGRKPGARAQLLSCIRRTRQTSTGCPCTVPADQPASRSRLVAFEPISSGRPLRAAGTIQRNGHGPSWLGSGCGAALKVHRPPVRVARSNRCVARVLVRRVTPDAQTLVCADVLHVRRRDLVGPGGSWGACAPKSRAAGRLALPPAPSEPGPHRVAPRLLRSAGEVRAPPLPVGLPLGLAPLRTYCVRYGGWWMDLHCTRACVSL